MNQPGDNTVPAYNLNEFYLDKESGNGIYNFVWPQLNISSRVDRIKESTDHEVKGEVLIESKRPTSAGHLRSGRLNLTSPTARRTFSRSLADRDSDVDWDQVMEQLCLAALDEWRRGSPEVQLTGKKDLKTQTKWLIEPLVQLNNPTLIYGPGSTGKSWLGQYIAVLADAGIPRNGFGVEPCEGRVLYLDWETDEAELDSRVTMIRNGLGLEGPSHIWYKSMNQGLSNDIATVRNICLEHDITLCVFDSLGSACAGEPESAEVVLRTFQAIRSLGVSSLCIDHTNKEGSLFGSVYKFNAARMVFECKKDQQQGEDQLVFGMFHKKSNNGKLMNPMGLKLNFSEESITLERKDVRDTRLEEHMNVRQRIENLLRKGALTVSQIAEELDKTESHVRKALSESKNRYGAVDNYNGKWGLRVNEQEEEATETWRI